MENIELLMILSIAFFASLGHCIGMCGGITLAYSTCCLPHKPSFLSQIPSHLAYHFGRVSTYTLLGIIVGFMGFALTPSLILKNTLLLCVGVILVLIGLSLLFGLKRFLSPSLAPAFISGFGRFWQRLLKGGKLHHLYALGFLNGLLPCGIVYHFLLTASVAGGAMQGGIVMFIFGIATIPSLLLFGFASSALQNHRAIFTKIAGIGMIGFGWYEIYKALLALQIL